MYIKYKDYRGNLGTDDMVLISAEDYGKHKDELKGIPLAITPDGEPPKEQEGIDYV